MRRGRRGACSRWDIAVWSLIVPSAAGASKEARGLYGVCAYAGRDKQPLYAGCTYSACNSAAVAPR